ncbi:MAG: ATP-binding protein [Gammaproteobacteria bacterium]|nr:ATP-binding protein [Gammaproteobacteria bacterium]
MKITKTLTLTLAAGIFISLLLSSLMFQYELDVAEERFSGQANAVTENIKNSLSNILIADDKLSFLFQATDDVTDEDFLVQSRVLLAQIPYIKKIVYAPKIRKSHLEAEEKKLRNAGYTGFKFRSFPENLSAKSRLSEIIFPVRLIQPFTPYTATWLGRDILTFGPAQDALQKVVLNAEKGKIVHLKQPGNVSGVEADEYYLFTPVTFPDITRSHLKKSEDIFAVLGYQLDFSELLFVEDGDKNIAKHFELDGKTLYDYGVFRSGSLFSTDLNHTIDFEGQRINLRYQLKSPISHVDLRIPLLILFFGLLITILGSFVVKGHLERLALLSEQNKLIENKVAEKTALLEEQSNQINKAFDHQLAISRELESFSYSISHDLRAPLRSISGFANALNEDYGNLLDEQGIDMLQRVQNGAEKMSVLIDDLLSLSRVARQAFNRTDISLSDLAQQQIGEIIENYPTIVFDVEIEKGLTTRGDRNLIGIVLNNLLGNAAKYASKSDKPKIELGVQDQDGSKVFFVRDNGVGFDMAYKNKLFVAFQRLHGPEFEGTGIGLATVQRIINRHGGKIWAESELGEGATFYFTLG